MKNELVKRIESLESNIKFNKYAGVLIFSNKNLGSQRRFTYTIDSNGKKIFFDNEKPIAEDQLSKTKIIIDDIRM